MQSYLFFGPPGSGKGAQKDMLEQVLKERGETVMVIETGQLLREFAEEGDTLIQRLLSEGMERGDLVPSAFPINTWIRKLGERKERYEHIIIDGAGRKLPEAKIIIELLLFFPDPKVYGIYLAVPDEEVMRRMLQRGRSDDQEEVIKNRLEQYRDEKTGTMASINFLRNNDAVAFHEIDGVGTMEEVHQRVCEKLGV